MDTIRQYLPCSTNQNPLRCPIDAMPGYLILMKIDAIITRLDFFTFTDVGDPFLFGHLHPPPYCTPEVSGRIEASILETSSRPSYFYPGFRRFKNDPKGLSEEGWLICNRALCPRLSPTFIFLLLPYNSNVTFLRFLPQDRILIISLKPGLSEAKDWRGFCIVVLQKP